MAFLAIKWILKINKNYQKIVFILSFVIWYQSRASLLLFSSFFDHGRWRWPEQQRQCQSISTPYSFLPYHNHDTILPENILNPFFLHSGDHPCLSFVSHPLIGSNYNTWSRSMMMVFNAKNKIAFIDATLPQPNPDDPTAAIWSGCNSMISSWLLNALSKEIADSLLYLDLAQAFWADLHDRFHQSKTQRIFQIKQLHALSQGSMDLTSYFTKLKIHWDELKIFHPFTTPKLNMSGQIKLQS